MVAGIEVIRIVWMDVLVQPMILKAVQLPICIVFVRVLVIKCLALGVQKQVQFNRKHRNEIASSLAVGDWVLFDGHKDEVELIWLCRVMSNTVWEGQGVSTNATTRKVSYKIAG